MAFSKARSQRSFLRFDKRVEVAMAAGSPGVLFVSWLVAFIAMLVHSAFAGIDRRGNLPVLNRVLQ